MKTYINRDYYLNQGLKVKYCHLPCDSSCTTTISELTLLLYVRTSNKSYWFNIAKQPFVRLIDNHSIPNIRYFLDADHNLCFCTMETILQNEPLYISLPFSCFLNVLHDNTHTLYNVVSHRFRTQKSNIEEFLQLTKTCQNVNLSKLTSLLSYLAYFGFLDRSSKIGTLYEHMRYNN